MSDRRRHLTSITDEFESVYDGDVKTAASSPDVLYIECEAIAPPSMKGREVFVFLDVRDVTDVLLLCRESAIAARNTAEQR